MYEGEGKDCKKQDIGILAVYTKASSKMGHMEEAHINGMMIVFMKESL